MIWAGIEWPEGWTSYARHYDAAPYGVETESIYGTFIIYTHNYRVYAAKLERNDGHTIHSGSVDTPQEALAKVLFFDGKKL